jgi:hypothetical protein
VPPTAEPTLVPTVDPADIAALAAHVQTAQATWQNTQIASYRITVLETHGIWSAQRTTLTVNDGHVVDIQSMCFPAPIQGKTCTIQPVEPTKYLVPSLLMTAHDLAEHENPAYLNLTFDPTLGYPTMIGFNDPQILDEDYGIKIENFEQLPGKPTNQLGTTIALHIGETIQADGLTITLVRVVEDSRCPSNVNCAWSGQIVVEVAISVPNASPELLQLKLLGTGLKLEPSTLIKAGGQVQLTGATPYPSSPDRIQPDAYVITLQLSK